MEKISDAFDKQKKQVLTLAYSDDDEGSGWSVITEGMNVEKQAVVVGTFQNLDDELKVMDNVYRYGYRGQ